MQSAGVMTEYLPLPFFLYQDFLSTLHAFLPLLSVGSKNTAQLTLYERELHSEPFFHSLV